MFLPRTDRQTVPRLSEERPSHCYAKRTAPHAEVSPRCKKISLRYGLHSSKAERSPAVSHQLYHISEQRQYVFRYSLKKTCMICPFFYTKNTCLLPHVFRLPPNRQFFPKNRTDLPKKEPRMRFLHLAFQHTQLAPDRACACGAKLSTFAPSTNVISPQLSGAATKKEPLPRFLHLAFQHTQLAP